MLDSSQIAMRACYSDIFVFLCAPVPHLVLLHIVYAAMFGRG